MTEFLRNAVLGWARYTSSGKLAALLFISIIVYILCGKKIGQKNYNSLFIYTILMTILCICPLTAVFLMLYQTKFYDYEWIFSYVPITAIIAACGCGILLEIWNFDGTKRVSAKKIIALVMVFFMFLLCGRMDALDIGNSSAEKGRLLIQELIDDKGGKIVLWAPAELMESASLYFQDVELIYGRNMWDESLNAYTYDSYDEEIVDMYRWMELIEKEGLADYEIELQKGNGTYNREITAKACVKSAISHGVNLIVLPHNVDASYDILGEMDEFIKADPKGNYVYVLDANDM